MYSKPWLRKQRSDPREYDLEIKNVGSYLVILTNTVKNLACQNFPNIQLIYKALVRGPGGGGALLITDFTHCTIYIILN